MHNLPDDTPEQELQLSSDEPAASPRRKKQQQRYASVAKLFAGLTIVAFAVTIYVLANRNSSASKEPVKRVWTASGKIPEVEVLDGVGNMKLAQHATDYIRSAGYDVVEMKRNAEGVEGKSFIIDHTGNLDAAKQLALALGISETKVYQKINPKLLLDITVVIGEDYPSLAPYVHLKERNVR
ncbi:MAG TPA: LytR C-terminal domain-containing protein [Bacteroidota bacterium]|nr:LytR C-terminal domain-containing protein [Bacteroidota bacterium]